MADIRVFQERRLEDSRGALAGFLQGCVLGEADATLTDEEAATLADAQWLSQPLLTKIMRFANGSADTDEPEPETQPGAGSTRSTDSGAPPAPPAVAG